MLTTITKPQTMEGAIIRAYWLEDINKNVIQVRDSNRKNLQLAAENNNQQLQQ